jgi:lysyl-tRNA synthetase, class I
MEFSSSKRIDPRSLDTAGVHWASVIADKVIEAFPNLDVYTVAAGISPSGVVHFGNFRDVMTSYAVLRALEEKGKKTRFVFSWDNYDRLRKVPKGVDASFEQYIGMPISKVPDPTGKYPSYAHSFQAPFVEAMKELGIKLEYKEQTNMYESGIYAEKVIHAMKERKAIGEILFSLMTEKAINEKGIVKETFIEEYYPISIYSRMSGKDTTTVKSFDGESLVTYFCHDTKQEDRIDLKKDFIYKLGWKIDWPMRWEFEHVVFEPGGHDHASPGSSFDVSSLIAEQIFGAAPVFVEYKFVGIQGMEGKMSSSKGDAVSPMELLDIYEPRLLKWLYMRKTPAQPFSLAFDTEIFRQYDEYDMDAKSLIEKTGTNVTDASILYALHEDEQVYAEPTSFRQTVSFGQVMQWDQQKMEELFKKTGSAFEPAALKARIPKAKNWVSIYNPEEMITVRDTVNEAYVATLSDEQKKQIATLRITLEEGIDPEALEPFIYSIPKDESLDQKANATRQRAFFKDIYNLLISNDTGPRLATFLQALDREVVLKLLAI